MMNCEISEMNVPKMGTIKDSKCDQELLASQ
jgi:hypothetical protein